MTFVRKWRWHILGGGAVALVVAQVLLRGTTFFPESGEADVASSVNDFQSWVRDNRDTNWFLHGVLRPIGDFVLSCYEALRDPQKRAARLEGSPGGMRRGATRPRGSARSD